MSENKNDFSVKVHDNFFEIHLSGDADLERRLKQIESIVDLVVKSRKTKLLVILDSNAVLQSLDHIQKAVSALQKEDWKLRNKGLFLKIAYTVYKGSIVDAEFNDRAYKSRDIDIQGFENREEAISWLSGSSSLSNITAHYQPIVRLDDRRIVGYEALARKIVDGKVLPPREWLPSLFSEEGGSLRLTRLMLESAFNALDKISAEQYISINFEAVDLKMFAYKDLLSYYPLDKISKRLVIELAERNVINPGVLEAIEAAKQKNIRIAFDDIGAGASRFLAFVDIQPDIIKLDKAVTDRIHEKPVLDFIHIFSRFAHIYQANLLAEGVEDEDQVQACINAGIKYGQGYLFGKAAPID